MAHCVMGESGVRSPPLGHRHEGAVDLLGIPRLGDLGRLLGLGSIRGQESTEKDGEAHAEPGPHRQRSSHRIT